MKACEKSIKVVVSNFLVPIFHFRLCLKSMFISGRLQCLLCYILVICGDSLKIIYKFLCLRLFSARSPKTTLEGKLKCEKKDCL